MLSDLRFALRVLRKNPGFTVAVVLSLALGIGANATVLCWMRHLVLRPLPGVANQDEVVVFVSNRGGGNVSMPDLGDLAALENVFAGGIAWQTTPASLTVDNQPEWIDGQVVSANFFDLLGVKPAAGRTFFADEDQTPGGNPVLVISERLWRRRFHGDPDVLGRVVDLNRHSFTIIGVAPEAFRGTMTAFAFDFWAPLSMTREVRNQALSTTARDARGWHNLARLRPGVSAAQAQAAVTARDAQLASTYPATNTEVRHRVLPYSQCPYGAQAVMGPVLRLLFAVSLGVLLIVAANVANLSLARATARRKEIAIRLAAGAGRLRLMGQFLTESLLLALLGGLGGTLLAGWMIDGLPFFLTSRPANLVLDYQLEASTLGLTLLLTLGTGVAIGLLPAWQATRTPLAEALKEGGRSSASGPAHHRLRGGLVVAEMALALVLLVSAALCLKGLEKAREVKTGIDADGVVLGQLQIGMNGYDEATGRVFYRDIRQRLADTPGVEEAALASWFPLGLSGCKGYGAYVEGYLPPPGEDTTYEYAIVSPRYFAALKIPLLSGRDFTDQDDASAPFVAIVNETFARRFWPEQDPLGRRFRCGGQWRTIVGVARTGKYNRLDEGPTCFFYLPYQQGVPDLDLNLCVRIASHGTPADDPGSAMFANTLRRVVRDLDPGAELLRVQSLSDHTQAVIFTQRMASTLLTLLGTVALILAAMGVYAVMAYAVSQRTQEFGIRMAIGARTRDVLWSVLRQGLALAAMGAAVGLALAAGLTRLMASFLYGVSPFDPATFAGVPIALGVVALLACWLPARRATRADPMIALRSE